MRLGSLHQSTATRNLGNACFTTRLSDDARRINIVLPEIPPERTDTCGTSSAWSKCRSRRYTIRAPALATSIMSSQRSVKQAIALIAEASLGANQVNRCSLYRIGLAKRN